MGHDYGGVCLAVGYGYWVVDGGRKEGGDGGVAVSNGGGC